MDIRVDPFPIINIFNLDYLFKKCLMCVKNSYHNCDRLCKYIEQIIKLSTNCSLVSRVFVSIITEILWYCYMYMLYVHKIYPVRIICRRNVLVHINNKFFLNIQFNTFAVNTTSEHLKRIINIINIFARLMVFM